MKLDVGLRFQYTIVCESIGSNTLLGFLSIICLLIGEFSSIALQKHIKRGLLRGWIQERTIAGGKQLLILGFSESFKKKRWK